MGLVIIKEALKENVMIDRDDIINIATEIENSCNISVELVNDLLKYEKLEAGLMILEKEITNADVVFSEALRPFIIQVFYIYIYCIYIILANIYGKAINIIIIIIIIIIIYIHLNLGTWFRCKSEYYIQHQFHRSTTTSNIYRCRYK